LANPQGVQRLSFSDGNNGLPIELTHPMWADPRERRWSLDPERALAYCVV